MAHHVHITDALVLKALPRAETDRMVWYATDRLGIIVAHIKNSRDIRAKFHSLVEPATRVTLAVVAGKFSWKVVGLELKEKSPFLGEGAVHLPDWMWWVERVIAIVGTDSVIDDENILPLVYRMRYEITHAPKLAAETHDFLMAHLLALGGYFPRSSLPGTIPARGEDMARQLHTNVVRAARHADFPVRDTM